MSKDLPFFKFFPSEWLTGDISDESDKIQGQFIRVCAIYWNNNCDLTMDKLIRKVHQTKVKGLINHGFIDEKLGSVYISFLDEQYMELSDLKEKRRLAGAKGGKASVKQRLSKNKADVNHLDKDKDVDKDVDKEEKQNSRFTPPTEEEVFQVMKEKISNQVLARSEAMKFVLFYESKNWMVGKNKMKVWKASSTLWTNKVNEEPKQVEQSVMGPPRHHG